MGGGDLPLLWHLPISHHSEKVRWAFDFKQVPHRRRLQPAEGPWHLQAAPEPRRPHSGG